MFRQTHVIDVSVETSSLNSNEIENGNTDTLEKNIPHNGKPISKMATSPRSEYVLTYSQADESFVGWLVKDGLEVEIDLMIESPNLNVCDFKISDGKVILYDSTGSGEIKLNLSFSNDKENFDLGIY